MSEKKPIIKVSFAKPKESWYRIPSEDRNEIMDKLLEKGKELGMKSLVVFNCHWSCEEWLSISVEEYPDMEALQEFENYLIDVGWATNIDSKLYMGTRWEAEEFLQRFVSQQI